MKNGEKLKQEKEKNRKKKKENKSYKRNCMKNQN